MSHEYECGVYNILLLLCRQTSQDQGYIITQRTIFFLPQVTQIPQLVLEKFTVKSIKNGKIHIPCNITPYLHLEKQSISRVTFSSMRQ